MPDITLTPEQITALDHIREWMTTTAPCFLLKGSAGTGKTTLVRYLIEKLAAAKWQFRLLAPTGRAARILGMKTGHAANTIHRTIYDLEHISLFEDKAQTSADVGMRLHFSLKRTDPGHCLFIVDESSMVGDVAAPQDLLQFGSDRLLADLLEHARLKTAGWNARTGARILFVGDPAQLPPVNEQLSPALSEQYLREEHKLGCRSFELKQVMRQQSHSGVLTHATALRDAIQANMFNAMNLSPNGRDVRNVPITEAIDVVERMIRDGKPAALVAHANSAVFDLNRVVRGRLWGDENADLRKDDLLLVNMNSRLHPLSNGDIVKVNAVSPRAEVRPVPLRGEPKPVVLKFRHVELQAGSGAGEAITFPAIILENLLHSKDREITPGEQRALLVDFIYRNPGLKRGSIEFKNALQEDRYFNALRVKYGYALTCHKAQGGEWDTVVVDFSGNASGRQNENFFRWTYTAITRAQTTLLTVGAPNFSPISSMQWGQPQNPSAAIPTDPNSTFPAGSEALFARHCELRDAWQAAGIAIAGLEHLQYRERYCLQREQATAWVDYTYSGKFVPGPLSPTHGKPSDPDLLRDAQMAISDEGATTTESFLRDFRARLGVAIAGTDIRLLSDKPMQHRLRVTFEWRSATPSIDFLYDGRMRWTKAQEVGGPGSSNGLLAFLQTHFKVASSDDSL